MTLSFINYIHRMFLQPSFQYPPSFVQYHSQQSPAKKWIFKPASSPILPKLLKDKIKNHTTQYDTMFEAELALEELIGEFLANKSIKLIVIMLKRFDTPLSILRWYYIRRNFPLNHSIVDILLANYMRQVRIIGQEDGEDVDEYHTLSWRQRDIPLSPEKLAQYAQETDEELKEEFNISIL